MNSVSSVTILIITADECTKTYDVKPYGPKADKDGVSYFFDKISLQIPTDYLREDKEAKIKTILEVLCSLSKALQDNIIRETKFKADCWNVNSGNIRTKNQELQYHMSYVSKLNEAYERFNSEILQKAITFTYVYKD